MRDCLLRPACAAQSNCPAIMAARIGEARQSIQRKARCTSCRKNCRRFFVSQNQAPAEEAEEAAAAVARLLHRHRGLIVRKVSSNTARLTTFSPPARRRKA